MALQLEWGGTIIITSIRKGNRGRMQRGRRKRREMGRKRKRRTERECRGGGK